jgi:sec-independent protein translocase protein TatA
MGLSIWQILIIVAVIVLLFGANRIPRLMRDMGSGITAFRKGLKDGDDKEGAAKDEPAAIKDDSGKAAAPAPKDETAKKA